MYHVGPCKWARASVASHGTKPEDSESAIALFSAVLCLEDEFLAAQGFDMTP